MVTRIIDRDEKDKVMRSCDSAFPLPICDKENYAEIFNKINQYADFLVDYQDGDIAGYAAMYNNDLNSRTAYISMIGVREEYQGKHIGSLLMKVCKENAQKKGMKAIRLEVFDSNKKAIGFYEKEGFEFEKRCSENSIYMIYIIPD